MKKTLSTQMFLISSFATADDRAGNLMRALFHRRKLVRSGAKALKDAKAQKKLLSRQCLSTQAVDFFIVSAKRKFQEDVQMRKELGKMLKAQLDELFVLRDLLIKNGGVEALQALSTDPEEAEDRKAGAKKLLAELKIEQADKE